MGHKFEVLGNGMQGQICHHAMGLAMKGPKPPNLARGHRALQNGHRTVDPLIQRNQFDRELGKALGQIRLLGCNDEEIVGMRYVVIEGAF
jgi:hypothetical protein